MDWMRLVAEAAKELKFWIVLMVVFGLVMLLRVESPPLKLPEQAHNTIGDLPLLEQADDGYVSSVGQNSTRSYGSPVSGWVSSYAIVSYTVDRVMYVK